MESLESSLGQDALAPALYEATTHRPDILLVDGPGRDLFGSFALTHLPAAMLIPLSDPDLAFADKLGDEGDLIDPKDYDLKGSSTDRVYAYIEEDRVGGIGAHALELAQKRMNLVSPFDRVRTALHEIAQVEQTRTRP